MSTCSVAASYKPPMLVTRVRLPACAVFVGVVADVVFLPELDGLVPYSRSLQVKGEVSWKFGFLADFAWASAILEVVSGQILRFAGGLVFVLCV